MFSSFASPYVSIGFVVVSFVTVQLMLLSPFLLSLVLLSTLCCSPLFCCPPCVAVPCVALSCVAVRKGELQATYNQLRSEMDSAFETQADLEDHQLKVRRSMSSDRFKPLISHGFASCCCLLPPFLLKGSSHGGRRGILMSLMAVVV